MFARVQNVHEADRVHAWELLDSLAEYGIIVSAQSELIGKEMSHGLSDVSRQLPSRHCHARAVLDTGALHATTLNAVPTRVTSARRTPSTTKGP